MNETFLGKGIAAWIGSAVPRPSLTILPLGHLALCATALFVSAEAALVVFAVSVVALLRYAALVGFAVSIGHRQHLLAAFEGALWLFSFIALAVAIVAVARDARAFLPWAAGAALVGPLLVTAMALVSAGRTLARARREKGVAR